MSRPDWVACVAHTHANKKGESWCGRRISMEFFFVDVDHAIYNGIQGGRLQTCPDCCKVIRADLHAGEWVK